MTLQKSGIRTPFDLAGKTIMLDSNVYKYPALSALILKTLGGSDKVTQIQETFRNEDLLEGKTDAMVAYLSDQPFWFKEKGIPVNVIDPRDYGIDFYGDNFFTTEKEIYKNPDRIKKIIRASLKGWDYALTHQQEMIDLIHLKYNPQKLSRKHLIHESKETEKMIVPRFVKLGHFEPSRFQKIIETYVQLGLTDQAMIDEGFFYQDGKKSAINRKIKPSFHLTQEERAWLKSHPVIRVSSELDYAPFDFVENNKSVGFSIDYLNLIAGKVGLQLTFVQDTWKNLIKMGKEKEIDLLHSIFYTPERDAFFSFTEPYKTVVNAIYVKTGITGITSISDLANRRVALSKSGSIAKLLPQLVPDAEFIFVDNYEETLKATSLGKADATILDTAVGNYLIRQNTLTNIIPVAEADIPTTGTDPRYRLAVHKDASELHSILQKAMNTVTRDEMAEIELRWFSLPTAFDGATDDGIKNLTPEEQTWLKAHPVIRVHNEKDWPPFNYNEYDSPRGLSIDYMNLLAKKLGVTVEYVNGPSWNEFLGMIKEKKLDVMLNIVKTEERQKYILYTPPFMRTPVGIASLDNKPYDNIENLFGKTVAFPKGFVYEEILTKKFPQILQLPLKNTLESLKAVSFGKADAALGKAAVMRYLVEKNLLSSLVISGEFQLKNTDLVDLRIGMRDDWPLLQSALTKAMQTVTPEEMKEIQGKWLLTALNEPLVSIKTKPHTRSPQLTQLSFAQMVTYSVIIFLVVCLLAFILLRTLRRENVALNFGSPWFRGLVLIGLSIFVLIVAFLGWINLENNKTTHLKGVDESLKGLLSLSQERLDLW